MMYEKERCKYCFKELNYSIPEDRYEFCDCEEKKLQEVKPIPPAKDQGSMASDFERQIQEVIEAYCGQGLTVGALLGALQNRVFNLNLGIHIAAVVDVVKRNLK